YCSSASLLLFQLEFVFVFLQEFAEFVRRIQQTRPLLIVEGYGKASQAVDADSALLADPKLQAARTPSGSLLFQFGKPRFQFVISRFRHEDDLVSTFSFHDRTKGRIRRGITDFSPADFFPQWYCLWGIIITLSGSSSAVERQLPKLDVAGSIPVSRSNLCHP